MVTMDPARRYSAVSVSSGEPRREIRRTTRPSDRNVSPPAETTNVSNCAAGSGCPRTATSAKSALNAVRSTGAEGEQAEALRSSAASVQRATAARIDQPQVAARDAWRPAAPPNAPALLQGPSGSPRVAVPYDRPGPITTHYGRLTKRPRSPLTS